MIFGEVKLGDVAIEGKAAANCEMADAQKLFIYFDPPGTDQIKLVVR